MAVVPEPQTDWSSRWRLLQAGLVLWALVAALFLVLAAFSSFYDYFPSDEHIAHAIQEIDVPAFGGFVDFVNLLGDAKVYVALTLGLAFALAWRRAGLEVLLVLVTFASRALNSAIKDVVDRPRPSPELVRVSDHASNGSFPSGHVVGTALLFGLAAFVIPALVPWRPVRWLLQLGCLLLVVAAGPARVYAGVHWPSDVLGGYLLALLFLAPLVAVLVLLRRRSEVGSSLPEHVLD